MMEHLKRFAFGLIFLAILFAPVGIAILLGYPVGVFAVISGLAVAACYFIGWTYRNLP
jgi:hypothetical protein